MDVSNVLELPRVDSRRDKICARSSPLRILSVGRDAELLLHRERAIREHSDLSVRSLSPEEAEKFARSEEPRLWIFCGSIEISRLVYLACSVRRYSRHSRLVLDSARPAGFESTLFDCILRSGQETDALLEAVSRLVLAA
jgi:hypothetical protein